MASPAHFSAAGLAHRAYAAPQLRPVPTSPKFGCLAEPYDYNDDSVRDIWLDDSPRHTPVWREANETANRYFESIRKQGANPMTTAFMITTGAKLLQTAARGLPNMPPDWVNGLELFNLIQDEEYGLSHIYELVLNTDPAVAYLLNSNTPLETKLVIAHVYGHTDFSRNNKYFKGSRPEEILNIVGKQRAEVKQYLQDMTIPRDPETRRNPVKEFIHKTNSIKYLIDLDAEVPPLNDFRVDSYVQPVHPTSSADPTKVYRMPDASDRLLYSPEEWKQKEEEFRKSMTPRRRKFPAGVDRDILGFIAKHSPVLAPWQRRILQMKREQAYYFAPIMKTKVMNEGWASFWHNKLLMEDAKIPYDDMKELDEINGPVLKPHKQQLNPYWLGFNIWQDLYIKGGLGIPLTEDRPPEYQNYDAMSIRRLPQFDDRKAMEALYPVRANEKDSTFIEKYLTAALAEKLKLFVHEETEMRFSHQKRRFITSRAHEDIQKQMNARFNNMGQPLLEVIDGDYNQMGELLLNHSYTIDDLNIPYAKKTLQTIAELWGRPVHLDTYVKEDPDKPDSLVPVRYTIEPKTGVVQTFQREGRNATHPVTLNDDGTINFTGARK